MARRIQVVNIGPAVCVQGGISTVIELINAHLPPHISFRTICTFTRFTGDKEVRREDRGSRFAQACIFVLAFLQVLMQALSRQTVFHVHFSGRGSLLRKGIICVLLRILRCQYIVHSHAADTSLFQPWMPLVCRRALLWGLAGAGQVVVLTRVWQEYYSSLLALPESRVLLLPNPADLPPSIPDRTGRNQVRLLFLGRVGIRKGAFDLIRALAELPEDVRAICHLTMAGDGDVDEARALSTQLGCASLLSLPGWIGKDTVEKLLRESDLLLLPSYAEGMAMALIEAMSWGLPVITTRAGGADEFLEAGRNCLLVAPGDVPAISAAISELARDGACRQHMGLQARETMNQFSVHTYIARLSGVYEGLAGRLPGGGRRQSANSSPVHDSLVSGVDRAMDYADAAPVLMEPVLRD